MLPPMHEKSRTIARFISDLNLSELSQHLARLRRPIIFRFMRGSLIIYYSVEDANVVQILRLLSRAN